MAGQSVYRGTWAARDIQEEETVVDTFQTLSTSTQARKG